ncbi:glycosyltransferase [Stetteria hydrogenophila]
MRVALLHSTVNTLGGGERLLLAAVEAFKERGWRVTLATVEPTDWGLVERVWGRVPRPDREVSLLPFRVTAFGIYMRLASSALLPRLRRSHDVVVNTHGDIMVAPADVTYMHYPTFTLWGAGEAKYSRGFWRAYFAPFHALEKRLARRRVDTLLLTNSRFSRSVIKRHLGRNALVVYPPVDVERYLALDGRRRGIVVSVGRYAPEKRYEVVLEVARRLPGVEFHVAGSLTPSGRQYYERLKGMVESMNLKNVFLHVNLPQGRLEEILSEAKVYLHAMVNEHFGISVVEAMAAGLVPVVHRSGGPWLDIVDRGRYGLGYSTIDEAAASVRRALEGYQAMAPRARGRARLFSKEIFKERIARVVKRYAEAAAR